MILVTGASGFVGSHLVKHLIDKGEEVVSLVHDFKSSKWLDEALTKSIIARGDIRDFHFLKRVLNQYNISKVYHLAAQSIVKHAWKDPINTFDVNAMGTVSLLEACRQLKVERVMVQSTDKVYGNTMNASTKSPLKPTEPYGTSKICADIIAQSFIKTYDMDIVISRCCNIYGYDWNNRIIPNTIKTCLMKQNPIIYKNDSSKRQYIYIEEALEMFLNFMSGHYLSGPYNVATSQIKGQKDVVLEILKHFPSLKPKYVEKPSLKEIHSQSMNPGLNVTGQVSFPKGIKLTIKAFRKYGW